MSASRWSSLLLAAFALSPAAHAQTTFDTYRLTYIAETFGIFEPSIHDINEKGEMVGIFRSRRDTGEPAGAILLRDGIVIDLGNLMGGAHPSPNVINDLTQIVGTTSLLQGGSRMFLWEAGQMRDLGMPNSGALDINNRGQFVGISFDGNVNRPFLWEAGRTTFLELLPCPNTPSGAARAINENGVIVGQSAGPVVVRAVMWRDGEVMVLQPTFPMESGDAVDVNDRGEAIVIGQHTSFLWREDGVTVLPTLDLPDARPAIPASINNEGQIVGFTLFNSGPVTERATLWQEGAVVDLNALVSDDDPLKPFVTLNIAKKITDSGLIVAFGRDSRDPLQGAYYLLTPTGVSSTAASPPPSSSDSGGGAVDLLSLLLLILGLSCFARSQRVRCARPFG